MPIPITCPSCQANGLVPDTAENQNATCPICQTTFVVRSAPVTPSSPPLMPSTGGWMDPLTVAPELPVGQPRVTTTSPPESSAIDAWLQAKRTELDTYVTNQLTQLRRQRHENAEAESRHEASCIQRSIELSRVSAELDNRRREIEAAEARLRSTEAAIQAESERVERRHEELAAREANVMELENRRRDLHNEATSLASLVAELRPLVEDLELRKSEAQTIMMDLKSRQAALDRRLLEVGRNEVAIQKRMTELQELERSLQDEIESREAELERQRMMLLEEVRSLRSRLPVDSTTPPPRTHASVSRSDESTTVTNCHNRTEANPPLTESTLLPS